MLFFIQVFFFAGSLNGQQKPMTKKQNKWRSVSLSSRHRKLISLLINYYDASFRSAEYHAY